ncbi:MAG: 4Fe-4S dicluster domain-containing protein, partial [Anaerolineae bacterium]|nr:4Fe-4S dicluster domain-containing protein [Anaerolineae bacterium]
MQHAIPVETLGPQGQAMADAVQACVHCGFCLPACPTYRLLGEEMDSPRGRIYLMKETLEGALPLAEAMPYIDHCLGCVGCVPACPSGVPYGDLITSFRAYVTQNDGQSSSIG